MKIVKGLTLLIPLIISLVVLAVCIVLTVQSPATDPINILDAKLNLGISIIGLAITVWVGLNIYNLIERKDLERLIEKISEIEKKSEELNRQHEHYIEQARTQGRCIYSLIEVARMKEELAKEQTLLGGSEYSYVDYIEGFVQSFEKYARENSNLDTPFDISMSELFDGYTRGLTDLANLGWNEAGSHLRTQDIMQLERIIESVNSMVRDKLFRDLNDETLTTDEVIEQIYIDILRGIELANDAQLGIISEHLKAQYMLITGESLTFEPELCNSILDAKPE